MWHLKKLGNLSLVLFLLQLICSVGQTSVKIRMGEIEFWEGSSIGPGSEIYPSGESGNSKIDPKFLSSIGYIQTTRSTLKDVWDYRYGANTGKLTISRSGTNTIDSVTVEKKDENGTNWVDIAIFSNDNKVLRRTFCKSGTCFVVSNAVCFQLRHKTGFSNSRELYKAQKTCEKISTQFKEAMATISEKETLTENFEKDISKVSWKLPGFKRKIAQGVNVEASYKNLSSYIKYCQEMDEFNGDITPEPRANSRSETNTR